MEGRVAEVQAELEGAVARICPAWLMGQRDDLVQAAMMKLMAAMGDREVGGGYLRKVAYCALVDEIRRVRARREVAIGDVEEGAIPAARSASPEEVAAQRQLGAGIRDCLQGLVETRRRAVTLHLIGYTVPEVGRLLGWEEKRVENLVYRGMADLRECLRRKELAP